MRLAVTSHSRACTQKNVVHNIYIYGITYYSVYKLNTYTFTRETMVHRGKIKPCGLIIWKKNCSRLGIMSMGIKCQRENRGQIIWNRKTIENNENRKMSKEKHRTGQKKILQNLCVVWFFVYSMPEVIFAVTEGSVTFFINYDPLRRWKTKSKKKIRCASAINPFRNFMCVYLYII